MVYSASLYNADDFSVKLFAWLLQLWEDNYFHFRQLVSMLTFRLVSRRRHFIMFGKLSVEAGASYLRVSRSIYRPTHALVNHGIKLTTGNPVGPSSLY